MQQLEEFFALVNVPALCWRRVGDILSASDAMCRMFNMTKDELKQCNIVEV
jgi:PAS domain-containing protein